MYGIDHDEEPEIFVLQPSVVASGSRVRPTNAGLRYSWLDKEQRRNHTDEESYCVSPYGTHNAILLDEWWKNDGKYDSG